MELDEIIKGLGNLISESKRVKALKVIQKAFDNGEISEDVLEKAKYKSRKKVGGKWVYDYGGEKKLNTLKEVVADVDRAFTLEIKDERNPEAKKTILEKVSELSKEDKKYFENNRQDLVRKNNFNPYKTLSEHIKTHKGDNI